MNPIIDMHCHLLPGIDDGAKNMSDTMKALRMAQSQGVRKIIMTPHFYPGSSLIPGQVMELAGEVSREAENSHIDIEIFPGMECMYFSELPLLLEKKKALTLAGSRCVLIEFPTDVFYGQMESAVDKILEAGFVPVLAHYERYSALEGKKRKERLERLKELGCLLQMNYDTIRLRTGLFHWNPFLKDLKSGIVDFLGSDCHGSTHRPYALTESVRWLEKNLQKEEVSRMTCRNPRMLTEKEPIVL